jgi:prepilin-type processing-associated H-X9-DG protein
MMVTAIIGILVALLMPGITSAWAVANMTQCQTNLATLYKAQMNWNADVDTTMDGALNAGWAGSLRSYLEGRTDTLKCPSVLAVSTGAGGGGNPGSTTPPGDDGNIAMPPPVEESRNDEPQIELQDVTIGVLDAGGNLLYEIPLSPSAYWTMYQQWTLADGRVHIGANIDNDKSRTPDGSRYKDEDFLFTVEYKGDRPAKVEIGDCDGSANISYGKWSDFRVAHQPVWGGEKFGNQFAKGHVGEVVDLQKEMAKNGTLPAAKARALAPYRCWTIMSNSKSILGATSYGISRGSYQNANGEYVPRCDPKLFFILDYPKAVADYTDIGDQLPDKVFWSRIFINPTPPVDWEPPPGLDGWTWQETQALRHFGKANVLFCDGHIESLGPEDLGVSSPAWRYQGR